MSTKPGTADVTYTYRPSGQVQDRQFQGGPLVPVRYTIRDQMQRIGDPATTTYPFSARYAYHANGTVSESEFYNAGSPATAKRYRYVFGTSSYDALNRLKSADFSHYSGGWVTTAAHDLANIGYDAAGNLTALQRYRETGTLIDNLTYSYPGSSNRLSSVADAINTTSETWDAEDGSFTYDANGNMKTAPARYALSAVTYDHQNLPIALTKSGTTTTYRYDAGGMRISKQVGSGNTEVYLRDGSTTLGVFTVNGSGSLTGWHFNLLAGEQVIGRQPNTGNRRYYHTDLLGSTRSVVEGATIVESYDFEPWGLLMPGRTLGSGTKEGFTDKERDLETGLDYFGARYYMPALARWGSVDPLAEKHLEWSPYNYVLNNPLGLIDPDGRQVSAQLIRLQEQFRPVGDAFAGVGDFVTRTGGGLWRAVTNPVDAVAAWSALTFAPGDRGRDTRQDFFLDMVREPIQRWQDGGVRGKADAITEGLVLALPAVSTYVRSTSRVAAVTVADNAALDGSFSIIDWTGYPTNLPRPAGPFRILEGGEYAAARRAANRANQAMHQADPSIAGMDIHEIHPVKFGGSPTDPSNKIVLRRPDHVPATTWWNQFLRDLRGNQ